MTSEITIFITLRLNVEGWQLPVLTTAQQKLPTVGSEWPDLPGSIYAGIARAYEGEDPGHLVLLPEKPPSDLNWEAALKWAEGLGQGARLPTRFESALLYANLQDKVPPGDWYWTSTQYSANNAWMQFLLSGSQNYSNKDYKGRARAVRRFPMEQ